MARRPKTPWIARTALAALLLTPTAWAVDCNTLPAPIYGTGGSAQKPLFARFGARLAGLPTPRTVIYSSPGACFGINAFTATPTRMTGNASYWSAAGVEATCALPVAGQLADFGSMGNTALQCAGITALPAGVGDFEGPVTTWNFFVPVASSQQSISSAAAYFVYGFGSTGNVSPWTNDALIIRRDENSAAQIFVGLAAGIPPSRFRGVDAMTNARSISLVAMATTAEAAIGFASGENVDANRATVRTLAYQHTGQTCGYRPDSTATSFDKANVRDGHYWLWSSTHLFARVGADGRPSDPAVREFVGYFTGATPETAAVPTTELEIRNGNIPRCAMQVWRDGDLGPLYSQAPADNCACYFDFIATGSTTCTPCPAGTCATPGQACRRGYCEAY
ncbi:MAG: uncharacterized protein JWM10_899 [Myxococcaceae bacterium]|nr:uncharacterized protein [Myxococcaceae bacterium]